MIINLYAIQDKVANVFGDPFTAQNSNVAIRRFQYIMSKSEMVALDCALYELGSYDIETGAITSKFKFVCNFIDEMKEVKDEQK